MLRKILFVTFILVVAIAGIWGYLYIKKLKQPSVNVLSAIPSDCRMLIHARNIQKQVYQKLNQNNLIWEAISVIPETKEFVKQLSVLDSVLSSSEDISSTLEKTDLYFSLHPDKDKNAWLISGNLPDILFKENLENFLFSIAKQHTEIKSEHGNYFLIQTNFNNKIFYFTATGGVFTVSSSENILKSSLQCIQQKTGLSANPQFMKMHAVSGTANDLVFLINNKTYTETLNSIINWNAMRTGAFSFSSSNNWAEIDLNIKPDLLDFNGYIPADSSILLNAIRNQKPISTAFARQLPYETKSFTVISIKNYNQFIADMYQNDADGRNEDLKSYSDKINSNAQEELHQSLGEFAGTFFIQENNTLKPFGILAIEDEIKLRAFLQSNSDSTSKISLADGDSVSIFQISGKDVFNDFTASVFDREFKYTCLFKESLVFANEKTDLQTYCTAIKKKVTLAINENFKRISESNLSESSNLFHYSECFGNKSHILNITKGQLKTALQKQESLFENFNSFGMQLIADGKNLLIQADLIYSPISHNESSSIWELALDTIAITKPYIVINHKTGGKELFIQDALGQIYLISNTGKIQWKIKLDEKITSDVYQIDALKNNKLQLLFNTKNKIYLVDRNGNSVPGFPIKLPSPATNPLTLFDYDKNREYRIMIACEDHKLRNYKADGSQIENFDFPELKSICTEQVKWIQIQNKDFLILKDNAGNLYITGRNGKPRATGLPKLPEGTGELFFDLGRDEAKTNICFYNSERNSLSRLSLTGKFTETAVESDYTPVLGKAVFLNEDRIPDLLLVSESGFEVFDDAGRPLGKFKSEAAPENIEMIIWGDHLYFILLLKNETILLLDARLNTIEPPIKSSKFPSVSSLLGDNLPYLIGSHGNKVICSRIKL